MIYFVVCLWQHLCSFYIAFSLCVCVAVIGGVGTALCLLVPSVMFLVVATRLKLLVWLTWSLILILFNTSLFTSYLVGLRAAHLSISSVQLFFPNINNTVYSSS